MLRFIAIILLSSTFAVQSNAQEKACVEVIKQQSGYDVETDELAVYKSISLIPFKDEQEYWHKKSLLMPLITFKNSWHGDIHGGESLIILNPKTCEVLADLVIWED